MNRWSIKLTCRCNECDTIIEQTYDDIAEISCSNIMQCQNCFHSELIDNIRGQKTISFEGDISQYEWATASSSSSYTTAGGATH